MKIRTGFSNPNTCIINGDCSSDLLKNLFNNITFPFNTGTEAYKLDIDDFTIDESLEVSTDKDLGIPFPEPHPVISDVILPEQLPYGKAVFVDPYEFAISAGLLKRYKDAYMPVYGGQMRSITAFLSTWNAKMKKYRENNGIPVPALPTPKELSRKIFVPSRKKRVSENSIRMYLKDADLPVVNQ